MYRGDGFHAFSSDCSIEDRTLKGSTGQYHSFHGECMVPGQISLGIFQILDQEDLGGSQCMNLLWALHSG